MANHPQQIPPGIEDDWLPGNFRTDKHVLTLPIRNVRSFLESDLSVERIDDIQKHLWMVGRPYPPRPLNLQITLNRTIISTTDPSLHLVWKSKRIFVKPLPAYILSARFYEHYLSRPQPLGPALGLLYTYLALVPTELDFALARDANLIPHSYTWKDWKTLTNRVLNDYPENTIYAYLPRRYVYGELRLSRLDKIYRILYGNWLHGYSKLMGTTSYIDFCTENIGFISTATVYIVVVLTALQLGTATDALNSKAMFQNVCYGFTIFAILLPIVALGLVLALFVLAFFSNFSRTLAAERCRFHAIGMEAPRNPHHGKAVG